MFELKLSDVPTTKSTTGHLTDLGIFSKEINKASLENYTFNEFTLEELGLPSHTEILESVNKIKNEIGIESWKTNAGESNAYKGFSLTYNPDYIDKDVSIYHQTFGSTRLSQSFAFKNGKGNHEIIKNTYYDSYGFRKVLPVIDKHLGFLLNKFSCPLIRSRVAFLNMFEKHPSDSGWHMDESPNHLFRINIPIQTSEEYILDIEGSEKEVFSTDFENWLPKTKVIVIELHDAMKTGCSRAVFAAVNKYNFSFNFKGENIIFTNLSFEN